MAQNVIVPIIDLTSAAEGSTVSANLQEAMAFGSQNAFDVTNATTVIVNNTGFWRVTCGIQFIYDAAGTQTLEFNMSDGLSSKTVYAWNNVNTVSTPLSAGSDFDKVFFLKAGDSLSIAASTFARATGSYRQIADINGTLVNPSGFNPQ